MKNKSTAAILALFLGGLGVHQFYLKRNVKGIFYLVFCWTLVPTLIAFIDFIILLVMGQENFDAKYNDGQKSSNLIFGKARKIDEGIQKFLDEFPNESSESLSFMKEILPTLNPTPELLGKKLQTFLHKEISKTGNHQKDEIRKYLIKADLLPENFECSFNEIYFLTIIEGFLKDESLNPDEIRKLTSKAKELGIEKYENEEAIRKDFKFYIRNWEFDNGIFPELNSDFILRKNEKCIYRKGKIEILEQKEVTRRINYAGPRARIEIAKGLSYSLGSYNVSASKETIQVSKGTGLLNITTKRILFKADQTNMQIKLSNIVDLEPYSDGLMIFKSTGKPIIIKDSKGAELYQAVNGAIRNL